ncbi:hypothetical protein SAMN05444920_108145 [Nonomuraea solani]|uniref:Alpha amylase inhibitor n=1 Tax=Nonomuraea solani TaxID=1144553 RepID=A0A1H6E9E2_9ACTN|nr:hypothetical protein [Nonomuraea solani]SEG93556.1 hypothetical protein SAMN05444920_108145 [Nonomuraea solani]
MSRGTRIAAAVAGSLVLMSAIPATPAAAAATILDCDTFVHANDRDLGIAACSNPTGQTWIFRAVVVCGRAPDAVGEWVTLPPGGYGESQGYCAGIFTSGVGAVGVDERPA